MFDYTELNKLEQMCRNAGWNIIVRDCWEGKQIILMYGNGVRVNDAVIHASSYGNEVGLLETWHQDEDDEWADDVDGYLTAEQVFNYWAEDLKEVRHYD